MATQNSILNTSNPLASSAITIDPGASGDSYIQLSINATGEFRVGVDDDAGDAFKISQGSALGTSDTFIMTAAGERTEPLQPAFYGYVGTTITNVTGDATAYTIVFGSEVYDQNADFNTGTGVFTAPVTGRYKFSASVTLEGLTTSHTSLQLQLTGSNRSPITQKNNPGAIMNVSNVLTLNMDTFLDMDASDTASIQITVSGSTAVVDVAGDASGINSMFTGVLAC